MASTGATTRDSATPEGPRADVELRLPADRLYASVLRTTTAGLAARLDFPIDDIEDLRIAVSEASAMVLAAARPGTDLDCRFYQAPGELTVAVSVEVERAPEPDYDSFAWQVLATLAGSATAEVTSTSFTVTLVMRSSAQEAGR